MPALIRQWRSYSAKERSQYALECWGAVSLSTFLLLVALSFVGAPSMTVFARIGGVTTARFLAVLALVGALAAPGLVPMRRRLSQWWKKRSYAFLGASALLYAVFVFLFARDTGNFGAGVVFYGMFYNLLSLAGATLYRDA